jgi:hypothetical protein
MAGTQNGCIQIQRDKNGLAGTDFRSDFGGPSGAALSRSPRDWNPLPANLERARAGDIKKWRVVGDQHHGEVH